MNDLLFIIDQPVIDESGEEVILLSVWLLRRLIKDPELMKRVIWIDLDEEAETTFGREDGSVADGDHVGS